MIDALYVIGGLTLLVVAGDALVKGAVALSLRLGVSALVVSLTVVAFGTSAPEMLVAVQATIEAAPDLVYGNVVGSNIANVLLVLGVPALIAPLMTGQKGERRNCLAMLAASFMFIAVAGLGGMTPLIGAAFLGFLAVILYDTYQLGQNTPEAAVAEEVEEARAESSLVRPLAFVAAGCVGLPLGANLLIEGARSAAAGLGVSEAVIGLTVVAVGTSLPELSATVMAAVRGRTDIAVGNVLGSNMFNILAVMGIASFFGPLPAPPGFADLDMWVMFGAAALMIPFIFLRLPVGRLAGAAFLCLYAAYIYQLI